MLPFLFPSCFHAADLRTDHHIGRYTAYRLLDHVPALFDTPGKEKQESFVLWNLRANYRLCSFADVFVKGENLLAQRYEINAGFPMPKATVMGGVNINF